MPRGVKSRIDKQKDKIPNAYWADPQNIIDNRDLSWNPSKIMLGAIGSKIIGLKDDKHLCTVAGSRSGKGVSCVLPNLIHYKGSMLVIDPKGELASITARRRHNGLGQKVYVLDPFEKTADWCKPYRAKYNPLSMLHEDNKYLIEDAGLIADSLVVVRSDSRADPYWDDSSRNYIEAVVLYVAISPDYEGKRNLVSVFELLTMGKEFIDQVIDYDTGEVKEKVYKGVMGLCTWMSLTAIDLEARAEEEGKEYLADVAIIILGASSTMTERSDRERGSIMSTINRHVKFIGYNSIKSVLSDSDFDLEELKTADKGCTIYLCLPAGRMGICNRWLRLFINLALETMERLGQDETATGLSTVFCLDEFATLGYMKQIEDAAGQIASFHVKLWIILQDLTQLKNLYSQRWETFMGNAGVLQFFGNSDLTTLEYIQKYLGKTPVRTKKQASSDKDASLSTSYSDDLHDLITIDEAAQKFSRDDKLRRELVLWSGHKAMILQRVVFHDKDDPLYEKYFQGKYDVW